MNKETDLRTDPRDQNLDCNWVPGAMAGGGSSIPARGRLGSAGKGRGNAQGLTYDRFVLTDGVGRRPAAACGGGRRYPPLELLFRWRGGAGGGVHSTGRWCGVVWRC
jgi:hypothetical protein